jgi:hypothetical protein
MLFAARFVQQISGRAQSAGRVRCGEDAKINQAEGGKAISLR